MTLTEERATEFAKDWIEAWNSHDLGRILDHYSETIVFYSPFVIQIENEPDGRLEGRPRLRAYFARALERFPDLRFTLFKALAGVSSVTLYYQSVKGLFAAEVIAFGPEGKITRVDAHYSH